MDLPDDIWLNIYQKVHQMRLKNVHDEMTKKNNEIFDFIMSDLKKCSWREDLKRAYNYINDENYWDIIKTDPPPIQGYSLWENVNDIRNFLNVDVGVFAAVMYNMNFIAKHGFTRYKIKYPNIYT